MKRLLSMALVAVMVSASLSASAGTRKAEFAKGRKQEIRKEIRFRPCDCPKCAEFRRMQGQKAFMMREVRFHDARFQDPRFREAKFHDPHFKGGKPHGKGKKHFRR
jgi:hypothetical protein